MNDLKEYIQGLDAEVRKQYQTKVRKRELVCLEEGRINEYHRLVESTGITPSDTSIQDLESRLIIKDEWGKYESVVEATNVSSRKNTLQDKQVLYLKTGEIELFLESVKRAGSAPPQERIDQERPMILAQELEFILNEDWERYALTSDATKAKVEDSLIQTLQLRYLDAGNEEKYKESIKLLNIQPSEAEIKKLGKNCLICGSWGKYEFIGRTTNINLNEEEIGELHPEIKERQKEALAEGNIGKYAESVRITSFSLTQEEISSLDEKIRSAQLIMLAQGRSEEYLQSVQLTNIKPQQKDVLIILPKIKERLQRYQDLNQTEGYNRLYRCIAEYASAR